jgi:hypothetical protein
MAITLTSVCFDQLNLEYSCEKALELHEERLSHAVMVEDRSFEYVLLQMRIFCRLYAHKGFYDPKGRLENIVRAWYAALMEVKKEIVDEKENVEGRM